MLSQLLDFEWYYTVEIFFLNIPEWVKFLNSHYFFFTVLISFNTIPWYNHAAQLNKKESFVIVYLYLINGTYVSVS